MSINNEMSINKRERESIINVIYSNVKLLYYYEIRIFVSINKITKSKEIKSEKLQIIIK